MLAAYYFYEVAFGVCLRGIISLWASRNGMVGEGGRIHTHQIEVDAMIDQVVLSWFHVWWCAEIDSVIFTTCLDLLPSTSQSDQVWMEFREVLLDDGRGVAVGVASNKHRLEDITALVAHGVYHLGHLIEFVWADVWAVCEAEVELLREAGQRTSCNVGFWE